MMFYSFLKYRSVLFFVKLISKYLIFLDAFINGIVFLTIFSDFSLLVYRNIIDFCY